ncbi:NAD(P)-dependent dehydrogenase (short-subunit alcohol dehydrogenase family) [Streptomyces sp. 840.1]|uniref:SDR family oxidoreductase n=1 Tax=Streptomyces sp. 840.1 TaxID=2485152 RepID=UPI000F4A87D6|nr:SDR family oxidoreductase [Streptomyces sp. 840.1]ROQ59400.1 NAD(P)-dependent dehydrogenase (short-subunit alcohol dehydrogenase family) [Streptomyces sp. 840.1]
MTEPMHTPGLAAPPALGASALPPGTYDGAVVLVTGGGSGLGKAIAAEFARLGADLVLVGRNAERLAAARDELAPLTGGRVMTAPADIRDPGRIAAVFDAAEARLGLPQVLVNNAAANFPSPAEDLSPNAWRAVLDITLTGTWFTTREFGRRHLAAGTAGSIVSVGASYAWTGGPGYAHSAAAKAGVKNLVETLAVEWGPYGIRINGLVPGLMPHEDMTADIRGQLDRAEEADPGHDGTDGQGSRAGHGSRDEHHEHDARQPALRVGLPRELGWAATFLASPYAGFISGHSLVVDGANWQRRSLVAPPVVPVREQLGRGPFTPPGPGVR